MDQRFYDGYFNIRFSKKIHTLVKLICTERNLVPLVLLLLQFDARYMNYTLILKGDKSSGSVCSRNVRVRKSRVC